MKFVRVPAGQFMMGSDESPESLARSFPAYALADLQVLGDEGPRHAVRITRPFYLGQHEVTVNQFRLFIERSGYVPESIADGTGGYGYNPSYDPARSARGDAFEGRDPRYSWGNPGFPQAGDHPVVNVTWNDAMAMARWLSETEGVTYRLPSEAEWEYACRAGSSTRYNTGDEPASLLGSAALLDLDTAQRWPRRLPYALPGHDGHVFTAPVGSFAPNAFGLFDMHGNVWEWVADWYGENYYVASPRDDPRGPGSGTLHVRRGGSWASSALYLRSSYRNWNTAETRYTLVGMRLLREVKDGDE
ncbi:formylglycine-generating enzyme family protein [Variovorax sp. J2P1-59]|uniref:formylglycine-generating enzyme family protein n=1 Tax=Variovorax flavidus TaxID=3053501 RepID=UPI0025768E9B|nr:formylglycine-generating enzyme family protein [Variovorax sp. J2P1-59]MDM0073634.1 formylglycine-generating enzyme family protein [Variovorax sp. J2P1-59]